MASRRRFSQGKALRALAVCLIVVWGAVGLEAVAHRLAGPRPAPIGTDLSGRFSLTEVRALSNFSEEAFIEIARRPLFWRDRGQMPVLPPEPAVVEAPPPPPPAPPPPPPQLVLVAVISTPDVRLAILQRADGGETMRLKVGETLEGWTLKSLHVDHVELDSGGTGNKLYLSDSIPKQAETTN
jgi:hypothetical protein